MTEQTQKYIELLTYDGSDDEVFAACYTAVNAIRTVDHIPKLRERLQEHMEEAKTMVKPEVENAYRIAIKLLDATLGKGV